GRGRRRQREPAPRHRPWARWPPALARGVRRPCARPILHRFPNARLGFRLSTYTYGHTAAVVGVHAARSAAKEAAFFLPYLTPGVRLVDVGCGPGSISLGLARAVTPGEVIGVDMAETVLE